MNVALNTQPQKGSDSDMIAEILPPVKSQEREPLSFSKCRKSAYQQCRLQRNCAGHSWNSLLKKLESKSPVDSRLTGQADQQQSNSYERRASPRHSSDAVILAFHQDQAGLFDPVDEAGKKGYAINVSQNGISFAARSPFELRDRHQLHVEDPRVNFALDVTAEVLRCEPLDHEFWRVDCKLATPLTDRQVELLKEHVPACYAG